MIHPERRRESLKKIEEMDRANVIAELENIQNHLNTGYSFAINYKSKLIRNTLVLLKEQRTRKGHWIEDETETYTENHDTWECSECHEPFTLTEGTPEENKFYFCPRCGADMC